MSCPFKYLSTPQCKASLLCWFQFCCYNNKVSTADRQLEGADRIIAVSFSAGSSYNNTFLVLDLTWTNPVQWGETEP